MPRSPSANRLPFWGGLALCLAVGALHGVDLVLFIDAATGFADRGPALARCAAVLAAAAVLWWLGRYASACPARQPGSTAALTAAMRLTAVALALLAAGQLAAAWQQVNGLLMLFAGHPDIRQITILLTQPGVPAALGTGLLALLAAVWLAWPGSRALCAEGTPPAAGMGILLLPWPFWLALRRFLADPASVDRLPATLRVLSAAALLLFTAALLRLAYVPAQPGGQGLYRTGMLCFLLGTCLELPQTLFELSHGAAEAGALAAAAAAGLFGLCGLAAAWCATAPDEPRALAPRPGAKRP